MKKTETSHLDEPTLINQATKKRKQHIHNEKNQIFLVLI